MPPPPPSTAPRASSVADLFERGRSANYAGRPAEGERLLRRAHQVLADPAASLDGTVPGFASVGEGDAGPGEAQVRVLLSLSTSLVQCRGAEAALEATARALALVERDRSLTERVRAALLAKCRLQQAMITGRTGRLDESLRQLDLALEQVDHLDPQDRFELLLSRGAVRSDGLDPERAEADFAEAADLAREHGLERQEFMARHNLAQVARLRGDLPRALRLHQELEHLSVGASAAVAMHGRGLVLLEAGLMDEALDLLRRAADEASATGQSLLAGDIQVDLALSHVFLSQPVEATEVARRARRTLVRREAPGLYRRAELALLQARLQRGHRIGEVASRARALAHEFRADGDRVAADLARLLAAEAETRRGQPDAALQQLRQLSELTRVGSLSTRMRARFVLAVAARDHRDVTTARRHVRAALLDLVETVGASSSLELRAATHLYAQDLAGLDLDLAGGSPREVLLALERWGEAAGRVPAVQPSPDPELARRVTVLRHLKHQVGEDPGRADALRPRLRELERSVAALSWAVPGAGGQGNPAAVTRADVAHALRTLDLHGARLVYLREAGGRLAAVTAVDRRCHLVDLGPLAPVQEAARRLVADLQTCARACGGPMEKAVSDSLQRSLRRMDDLVLGPLGAPLTGRVLVVPSPALATIPWGLLPSRRGRPTPVAPHLTSWSRRAEVVGAPRVHALAGPGLARAAEEVRAVAGTWPGGRVQEQADGAYLAEALATGALVHVAAHGRHREDSPLFSSLDLADGPHFLATLERSSIRASHVVLSACDSGRARQRGGAAALGLAAGLLALGVRTVLAAPCRIPDAVAAEHMPRYHQLLADGVPADEAQALAALDGHPLAGAFVVWGAPWRADRSADGR